MGRSWVNGWMNRWSELPGPAKFRIYTRVSGQLAQIFVVIVMATKAHDAVQVAGLVLAGAASVAAVEARPELSTWPGTTYRRWAPRIAVVVLALVAGGFALTARLATDDSAIDSARTLGIGVVLLGMISVVSYVRWHWWILLGIGVVTGAAFAESARPGLIVGLVTVGAGVVIIGATHLTLWTLRVIDDLEHAKAVEADLQVAEERLRFSRDLHDVVGRAFSTIAVKSELAASLSRAGQADRAASEMGEVKAVAVASMAEMRKLVRGYRELDLRGEVAGARSLLSSVGCQLHVEGDPDAVSAGVRDLAAWVVREGTTNIVRHSSATSATLAFGTAGMSLRNNGVSGRPGEWTGLRGLAERAAQVDGTLEAGTTDDEFVLDIRWEAP